MENLVSCFKSDHPLMIDEISAMAEADLSSVIHYKVQLRYDTQATVENIIGRLKELDHLQDNVLKLKAEIEKVSEHKYKLPECQREGFDTYQQGLRKALEIVLSK